MLQIIAQFFENRLTNFWCIAWNVNLKNNFYFIFVKRCYRIDFCPRMWLVWRRMRRCVSHKILQVYSIFACSNFQNNFDTVLFLRFQNMLFQLSAQEIDATNTTKWCLRRQRLCHQTTVWQTREYRSEFIETGVQEQHSIGNTGVSQSTRNSINLRHLNWLLEICLICTYQ